MRAIAAATLIAGLLSACIVRSNGMGFMRATSGRRKLAQAAGFSRQFCPQQVFMSNATSPSAIFDALTPFEYLSVARFMVDTLNFTFVANLNPFNPETSGLRSDDTSLPAIGGLDPVDYYGNTIYNIYLYPPNKTEALAFLDDGGPIPARFARVIVVRGAQIIPDTMEYKVGPLPISPETIIEPLRMDGEIPWYKRPADDKGERQQWADLKAATNAALTPLLLRVAGQCLDDNNAACDGNNISQWGQSSWIKEGGGNRIQQWYHFLEPPRGGSADELFPLPIAFKFNVTDPVPSNWYAFDFEHCTQVFATGADMNAALGAGTLTLCTVDAWVEPTYNSLWSDDSPQTALRTGSNIPGPRLYEPAGKRFQLSNAASPTSRIFTWLGWQGHVTVDPWRGLSFHDIRFKGERILYELSLQDQFVDYSGIQTIGSAGTFDSLYQIGGSQYPLRPGYDCPETAAYMDLNVMDSYGQIVSYKGAICFFEDSLSTTTWRHFDYLDPDEDDDEVATDRGVRSHEFVVRTIATIGNYDYIVEVRFQLDGAIDVRVFMAGYMQCTYWDDQHGFTARDLKFGSRIQQKTLANIHDHLSGWKLDFDINGTANTAHMTTVRAGTYDQIFGPGSTPSYMSPNVAFKYLDDQVVEVEQGWKLDFLQPAIYTVANDAAKDAWNNSRAYGIFHQYSAPQLLPNDHPLLQAAAWTKYNIAFSKYKDNETYSATAYYDTHSPQEPITSLDMIVNGEPIVNEDLVTWVSMGIIHVPRQEDVPLITNIGSDFQIKPINFFTELQSLDIVETDDFEACAPEQGTGLFKYTWSGSGNNPAFDNSNVTVANPLAQPATATPSPPRAVEFDVLQTLQNLGNIGG